MHPAWRDWLLRTVYDDPAHLQIMYGIEAARDLPERTLDLLPGYTGSSPVRHRQRRRIPAAERRVGEVLDSLHKAHDSGVPGRPPRRTWNTCCSRTS
jgi:hypothetical protein